MPLNLPAGGKRSDAAAEIAHFYAPKAGGADHVAKTLLVRKSADRLHQIAVGFRVARNRPYAGGFATRSYGRPQHGVHALPIEISRHLYMNEVTLAKNDGFKAIRALIDRLIFALIGLDLVSLAGGSIPPAEKLAAE